MGNVKFTIEVIEPRQRRQRPRSWGDIDPATGQVTGSYGESIGIQESESKITKENGYTNIITLPPGVSPGAYIEMREKELKSKQT